MLPPAARYFVRLETAVAGFHHWPGAPAEFTYLREAHRHLFVVRVKMYVAHHDREVEINHATQLLFTHMLDSAAGFSFHGLPDYDRMSCEDIAESAAKALTERYGPRIMEVEVLEDGILGAGVTYGGAS